MTSGNQLENTMFTLHNGIGCTILQDFLSNLTIKDPPNMKSNIYMNYLII